MSVFAVAPHHHHHTPRIFCIVCQVLSVFDRSHHMFRTLSPHLLCHYRHVTPQRLRQLNTNIQLEREKNLTLLLLKCRDSYVLAR